MIYITNNIVDEIYNEVLKRLKNFYNEKPLKPKAVVFGDRKYIQASKFDILEFKQIDINNIDYIFITELSSKMLVSLSNLIYLSEDEQFILKALHLGKKIYILKNNIEYKKYEKTLPNELYKKYFEYESILKKYNIKFINKIEDIYIKKNLLSLEDIKDIIKNNKVILEKEDIISPLAKDFIIDNNIKVERRK